MLCERPGIEGVSNRGALPVLQLSSHNLVIFIIDMGIDRLSSPRHLDRRCESRPRLEDVLESHLAIGFTPTT